jgi:hypothetical protein
VFFILIVPATKIHAAEIRPPWVAGQSQFSGLNAFPEKLKQKLPASLPPSHDRDLPQAAFKLLS